MREQRQGNDLPKVTQLDLKSGEKHAHVLSPGAAGRGARHALGKDLVVW